MTDSTDAPVNSLVRRPLLMATFLLPALVAIEAARFGLELKVQQDAQRRQAEIRSRTAECMRVTRINAGESGTSYLAMSACSSAALAGALESNGLTMQGGNATE